MKKIFLSSILLLVLLFQVFLCSFTPFNLEISEIITTATGTGTSTPSLSSQCLPSIPLYLLNKYEDWNLDDHIQHFKDFYMGVNENLETIKEDFFLLWKQAIIEKRMNEAIEILHINTLTYSTLTEEDIPHLIGSDGEFLIDPFLMPFGSWLFFNPKILIYYFRNQKEKINDFFELSLPPSQIFLPEMAECIFSLFEDPYTSEIENEFWIFLTSYQVSKAIINGDSTRVNHAFNRLSLLHFYLKNFLLKDEFFSPLRLATLTLHSMSMCNIFHNNYTPNSLHSIISFAPFSVGPFNKVDEFMTLFHSQSAIPFNQMNPLQMKHILLFSNNDPKKTIIIPCRHNAIDDLSELSTIYPEDTMDGGLVVDEIVSLLYCIIVTLNESNLRIYQKEWLLVIQRMTEEFLTLFENALIENMFFRLCVHFEFADRILQSPSAKDIIPKFGEYIEQIANKIILHCSSSNSFQRRLLNYLFHIDTNRISMFVLTLFPRHFISYLSKKEDDFELTPSSLELGNDASSVEEMMIMTLEKSVSDLGHPKLIVNYQRALDAGGPSRFWVSSIWEYLSPFNNNNHHQASSSALSSKIIMKILPDSTAHPAPFVDRSCGRLLGLALQKSLLLGVCPSFQICPSFLTTFLFANSFKEVDGTTYFFNNFREELEELRTTRYWGLNESTFQNVAEEEFMKVFKSAFEFEIQPTDTQHIKFTSPFSDENVTKPPSDPAFLMKECSLEEMHFAFERLKQMAAREFCFFIREMRNTFYHLVDKKALNLLPQNSIDSVVECLFSPLKMDQNYFKTIKNQLKNALIFCYKSEDQVPPLDFVEVISLFIDALSRQQLIRFIILWSGCKSISMIPWQRGECPEMNVAELDPVSMISRYSNLGFEEVVECLDEVCDHSPSCSSGGGNSSSSNDFTVTTNTTKTPTIHTKKRKLDNLDDGLIDSITVVDFSEFKRVIEEVAVGLGCESPFETESGRVLLFKEGIWSIWYKTCSYSIEVPSIDSWEILVHSLLASLNQGIDDMND